MGSKPSKSEPNSSKSDSDSSSNSGNDKLEKLNFSSENDNTIINRVWIVKKSISLGDRNVNMNMLHFYYKIKNRFNGLNKLRLIKPKPNVFKIKNKSTIWFMHWAIILELSNYSYVNIQFGKEGILSKNLIKQMLKVKMY